MKKSIAMLMALVMILSLSGCIQIRVYSEADSSSAPVIEGETAPGDIVRTYLENGYYISMTYQTETDIRMLLANDETASYVKIVFPVTNELIEQYNNIDWLADDYDAQIGDFVATMPEVKLTDLTDLLPTDEELQAYVGKTLGDLIDAGFIQWGYSAGNTEVWFLYMNSICQINVQVEYPTSMIDMDPYTIPEEELRALSILAVQKYGISDMVLDD